MKKQKKAIKQRAPLWKWIIIILLVLAMPLFFSYYRDVQTEQVIDETSPLPTMTQ